LPLKVRPPLKEHLVFATLLSETSLYQTTVNDPTNRGVMKQTVWILPIHRIKEVLYTNECWDGEQCVQYNRQDVKRQ